MSFKQVSVFSQCSNIMQSDIFPASHDTSKSDSRHICKYAAIYLVSTLNVNLVNIYLVFLKVSITLFMVTALLRLLGR